MNAPRLPHLNELNRLARQAGSFPASAQRITKVASRYGHDEEMIAFLYRFPREELFESRADFITRCYDLEILIKEKQRAPQEILRSPQE